MAGAGFRFALLRLIAATVAALAVLAPLGPVPAAAGSPQGQSEAPAVGALVLEEALNAPGLFRAAACPSGRGEARFEPTGFVLRTTGRCEEDVPVAWLRLWAGRVRVVDGDVDIAVRLTEGFDRAYLMLQGRARPTGDGYTLLWHPQAGTMQLMRDADEDDSSTILARQIHLPVPPPDAWTHLALRFEGPRIWALLDGQVVLSATDDYFEEGGIAIGVVRRPKPDADADEEDAVYVDAPFADAFDDAGEADREPVAATWRNLRVSALANGAVARAPSVRSASERPPSRTGVVPAPGTPPVPGDVVVEAPLDRPGLLPEYACPTGRGGLVYVGEGLMFKANGRCTPSTPVVGLGRYVDGLVVPDGEVSFDFKVANGLARAAIIANVRASLDGRSSYQVTLAPALGLATVSRFEYGLRTDLAQRTDLRPVIAPGDWNTLAIRLSGDEIWLLMNGLPALKAQDGRFGDGRFGLTVLGPGSAADEQEVAVVFRNLRVSALKGVADDRRPTYKPGS